MSCSAARSVRHGRFRARLRPPLELLHRRATDHDVGRGPGAHRRGRPRGHPGQGLAARGESAVSPWAPTRSRTPWRTPASRDGPVIDAFSVRKEAKKHGTGRRIEGNFSPGSSVVVVEDVITSGGSATPGHRGDPGGGRGGPWRPRGRGPGRRRPGRDRATWHRQSFHLLLLHRWDSMKQQSENCRLPHFDLKGNEKPERMSRARIRAPLSIATSAMGNFRLLFSSRSSHQWPEIPAMRSDTDRSSPSGNGPVPP